MKIITDLSNASERLSTEILLEWCKILSTFSNKKPSSYKSSIILKY